MDFKLNCTFNIPQCLIDTLGITEDTVFTAHFCDGQLIIESVTDAELEKWCACDFENEIEDSYEEGYEEGTYEGYEDGYERGYHDAMHGEKYDDTYRGSVDYLRDDEDTHVSGCESCEYFDRTTRKCKPNN